MISPGGVLEGRKGKMPLMERQWRWTRDRQLKAAIYCPTSTVKQDSSVHLRPGVYVHRKTPHITRETAGLAYVRPCLQIISKSNVTGFSEVERAYTVCERSNLITKR